MKPSMKFLAFRAENGSLYVFFNALTIYVGISVSCVNFAIDKSQHRLLSAGTRIKTKTDDNDLSSVITVQSLKRTSVLFRR